MSAPSPSRRVSALSACPSTVPVVDFRPFLAGDRAERKRTALELAGAFRNMGFAYLAGHGIDQGLIDDTFAEAGRFFALPRERKAEV